MRPPRRWNFFGSLRNSTSSETSSMASSMPATSLKVVLFRSLASSRALLLPKLNAPLPAILIWRMKKNQIRAAMTMIGSTLSMKLNSMVFGSRGSNCGMAQQLLLQLRVEPRLGAERHLDLPVVLHLPVFAGDLPQVRALRVVVDGGLDDLVGLDQLLELVLVEDIARRLHAVLEQHEQDDAAENGNPHHPGTWRHPELARSSWGSCRRRYIYCRQTS